QDIYGNTAPTYRGMIHFSSTDPGAFLPLNYRFTAADAGQHEFAGVLVTSGLQTITAVDTANGTILGSQDVLVVLPADHFVIVAPASVSAGQSFTITLRALDANGNVDPFYTGTVSFYSTDEAALLPADYTFTLDDAGEKTFTVTLNTLGNQTIVVFDVKDFFTGEVVVSVEGGSAPGGGRFISPADVPVPVTPPARIEPSGAPVRALPLRLGTAGDDAQTLIQARNRAPGWSPEALEQVLDNWTGDVVFG